MMKKRFFAILMTVVLMVGALAPAALVAESGDAAYLESDIMSFKSECADMYPANGSFTMGGKTYFRGIVNKSYYSSHKDDATANYRIDGRGYTKLSGVFGRVSGSGSGTLTITADGNFIGGFEFNSGESPQQIEVSIPAGTQQVSIRLKRNVGGEKFALADAYFVKEEQLPPASTTAIDGAYYLESDIMSSKSSYVNMYPANGSFRMGGTTYFRGIVNISYYSSHSEDGTANYRIDGRGYTKLSGVFGRLSGSGGGTLTITADGNFIGGFEFKPGESPQQIEVSIPAGTQQVSIRLKRNAGGENFALADAYFEKEEQPAPEPEPTPTPEPTPMPTPTPSPEPTPTPTPENPFYEEAMPIEEDFDDVTLFSKAEEIAAHSVVLEIDNPNAIAMGKKVLIDSDNPNVAPVVINGRTLVPVRFIAESFGAEVGWDGSTNTITITLDSKRIIFVLNSDVILVDVTEKKIDVPAQTLNDRTVIPLRTVAESLDKTVFWDDKGLIVISDGDVLDKNDTETIDALLDMLK